MRRTLLALAAVAGTMLGRTHLASAADLTPLPASVHHAFEVTFNTLDVLAVDCDDSSLTGLIKQATQYEEAGDVSGATIAWRRAAKSTARCFVLPGGFEGGDRSADDIGVLAAESLLHVSLNYAANGDPRAASARQRAITIATFYAKHASGDNAQGARWVLQHQNARP